jgi:hypothetical protein
MNRIMLPDEVSSPITPVVIGGLYRETFEMNRIYILVANCDSEAIEEDRTQMKKYIADGKLGEEDYEEYRAKDRSYKNEDNYMLVDLVTGISVMTCESLVGVLETLYSREMYLYMGSVLLNVVEEKW